MNSHNANNCSFSLWLLGYGNIKIICWVLYGRSHKKFTELKQAHVGAEPSKTKQTTWDDPSILSPSLHLVAFCQLCLVFVSCVRRRVVEGSGVGSAGYVVHFGVHGE